MMNFFVEQGAHNWKDALEETDSVDRQQVAYYFVEQGFCQNEEAAGFMQTMKCILLKKAD